MIDRRKDLLKIRVELSRILPPIWREILVPATYSFWDLHVGIQDAMGWLDYHLHEFRIKDRSPGNPTIIGIPPEELWEDQLEVLPGWEIPVTGYLSQPGDQTEYVYDFGDGWLHMVTLVSVEPREKGKRYPQCIGGARACPPEDCGGVDGYHELLDALLDPAHAEHEALSQWIPEGWGPELFKPDKVRFDSPRHRWENAFLSEG